MNTHKYVYMNTHKIRMYTWIHISMYTWIHIKYVCTFIDNSSMYMYTSVYKYTHTLVCINIHTSSYGHSNILAWAQVILNKLAVCAMNTVY